MITCAAAKSARMRPNRAAARSVVSRGRFDNYGLVPRDSFNREIDYLRLSVIDACNLRCVYCMPLEGLRFLPKDELLTPAEFETVARAAVGIGFRKFRLTGGEPTLRLDLIEIVERLAWTMLEHAAPSYRRDARRQPSILRARCTH